jgi:hypothetical protein
MRTGSGVEECPPQTRQCFGTFLTSCRRVTGRQDDPIGIELESFNIRCSEVPVVGFRRRVGRRQEQAQFGVAADLTGKCAVGRGLRRQGTTRL